MPMRVAVRAAGQLLVPRLPELTGHDSAARSNTHLASRQSSCTLCTRHPNALVSRALLEEGVLVEKGVEALDVARVESRKFFPVSAGSITVGRV